MMIGRPWLRSLSSVNSLGKDSMQPTHCIYDGAWLLGGFCLGSLYTLFSIMWSEKKRKAGELS